MPKLIKRYSQIIVKIKQLEKLKDVLQTYNDTLSNNSNNFEMDEFAKVKENFKMNYSFYEKNATDESFKLILQEINNFLEMQNVDTILNSLKEKFKNAKSNFFFDDSISLLTFCWGIQNDLDDVLDI